MRRVLAGLLVLVGIILIVIGFGSGTWWKPAETVKASTTAESDAGMIMTEAGVLEMVNDDVSVVARANGQKVSMVVARTSVIDTWISGRPVERISGLESWTQLASAATEGEPAPSSFMDSDLFNPENEIEGQDAVQLHFTVPEGDWSILAVTDGGVTPQVDLTWQREVTTPWMIPLMIGGLLLAATGAAILIHDSQTRSIAKQRATAQARAQRKEKADVTETTTIPALGGASPDDAADARADETERTEQAEDTGRAYGAGIVPASPRADDIRAEATIEDEPADDEEAQQDIEADGDLTEDLADDVENADDAEGADDAQGTDDVEIGDGEAADEVDLTEDTDTADHADGDQEAEDTAPSNDWRAIWGFGPKEN